MNTEIPKEVPEAIREYMSSLGKKGGAKNKAKGSAYFKWVRSKNKKRPVKSLDGDTPTTESLREGDNS